MSGFEGFSKKTFSFMKGLRKNNSKKWFDAHRQEYEENLLDPAKAFVEAMGEKLHKISAEIHAEPRINRSIRRINRDLRFSQDKSPYKDHLDLVFWEGASTRCSASSFHFRMFGDRMVLDGGIHEFAKGQLDVYREAVIDPNDGPALDRALKKVQKAGYTVGGAQYKKVPRGYDAGHKYAPYLIYRGLYAGIDFKIPEEALSPKFVDFCFTHYKKLAPLQRWLLKTTLVATG